MKHYFRIIGYWFLAEVLTLFLDLTLSFSGSVFVRLLCSICTVGILAGLMAQGGYAAALADRKIQPPAVRPVLLGLTGSAVPCVLWGMLWAARSGMLDDGFYRLYKLLCAPFLSVCNLISADVSAGSVPVWGMAVLGILSLIPCAAVCCAYWITRHRAQ